MEEFYNVDHEVNIHEYPHQINKCIKCNFFVQIAHVEHTVCEECWKSIICNDCLKDTNIRRCSRCGKEFLSCCPLTSTCEFCGQCICSRCFNVHTIYSHPEQY